MADSIKYTRPDEAPRMVKAADGKTTLYRYKVEGVIYAPSKAMAEQRLNSANILLDAARIVPDRVTAELDQE